MTKGISNQDSVFFLSNPLVAQSIIPTPPFVFRQLFGECNVPTSAKLLRFTSLQLSSSNKVLSPFTSVPLQMLALSAASAYQLL